LYISTSVREALGDTIIEAGFHKIPAIVPNVDGIPEIVLHNQTGIVIEPTLEPYSPPNNIKINPMPTQVVRNNKLCKPLALCPELLSHEILSLLYNHNERKILGIAIFERCKKEFSIDTYVNKLDQIYNGVIN